MTEITDADRKAAAAWCAEQPFPSKQAEAPMIAAGEYDHHSIVQAFAAHRMQERDRVVAWLREMDTPEAQYYLHAAADAIASGAHDQGNGND
jgi:hypothetical protein